MKVLFQTALLVLVAVSAILASSHSEAPNTASIPNADITDLYAFRSYETGRAAFVTFLLNAYPLQTPYGGPNYYSLSTEHFYELYLDTNSDGTEDYTFQWIYGNSLPSSSPTGLPYLYQEDLACNELYSSNTTPSQPATPINLGIGLNISAAAPAQLIALKVAGQILGTGGSLGNLNWEEYYFLNLLTGPLSTATVTNLTTSGSTRFDKPFDYAGQNSFGTAANYETYAQGFINNFDLTGLMACSGSSTGKVFVGQREDPFYISLGRIFDYLNLIPVVLPAFASLTIADCLTNNDLREKNVDTFALEIPIACLNPSGGVVNLWAGTRRLYHAPGDLTGSGSHIAGPQVSRMGNPLVNELVIGLIDKNRFSRQHPKLDGDTKYGFASYVLYPTLPAIINGKYRTAVNSVLQANIANLAPAVPRTDLVTAFLTGIPTINKGPGNFVGEVIRLNLTIAPIPQNSQDRLGIVGTFLNGGLNDTAGFPNGRRPGDDVVDIALMVMMGALCADAFTSKGLFFCSANNSAPIGGVVLTDGAPVRASYYKAAFPYFNTPTPGSYVDSIAGNVVTDSTKCYPASQHGRCPICAGASSASASTGQTPSASASTGLTPSAAATTCPGGSASNLGSIVMEIMKFF